VPSIATGLRDEIAIVLQAPTGRLQHNRRPGYRSLGTVDARALALCGLGLGCGTSPLLHGYYDLTAWGPIAIALLALLPAATILSRPRLGAALSLALAGLVALWLWSWSSRGWAADRDAALISSDLWLLYAALLTAFALLVRSRRDARLLLSAVTGGVLIVAGYLVVRMLAGSGPALFIGGRLFEPLGYTNAEAGLLLMGSWPLIAAAEQMRGARSGAALAGATLLVSVAVLGQSRGTAGAAAISALALLALIPGRLTRLWAILTIAAAVAILHGPLFVLYSGSHALTRTEVRTAAVAALWAAALAGAAWAVAGQIVAALKTRRTEQQRNAARIMRVCTAVLAAAVLTAAAVASGPLERTVRRQWHAFTSLQPAGSGARLLSGASNRYDYWRVALREFSAHPLDGVGAGNFAAGYFSLRRTTEDIHNPHSIELQALAELGLPGAAALAVVIGAVLAGTVRLAHAAGRHSRPMAVAGGGTFVAWLANTSVDWLHLFPGVTAIALAGAAMVLHTDHEPARWRLASAAVPVLLATGSVLGAINIARPMLAQADVAAAQRAMPGNPALAIARAEDSLRIDRSDLTGYYVKAAAYAALDEYLNARTTLLQAVTQDRTAFGTWVLLGDLATRRGDIAAARDAYARAASLDPRDPGLRAEALNPRAVPGR
jgi:O-antigen ligase